ncbi:NADP-dependent malic enzyme [Aix galericulata]|nr:NADP-dependent malic enzyme [Aix galericulata]
MHGAGKAAQSRDAARPLQLTMKRGYEVLRDPHLNKRFPLRRPAASPRHLSPSRALPPLPPLPRRLWGPCGGSPGSPRFVFPEQSGGSPGMLQREVPLQDRNEKLFYKVLTSDIERFMPIVYTPTVGLACQQYGLAFRRPRFPVVLSIVVLSRKAEARVLYEDVVEAPNSIGAEEEAIVVTDGERILGLGDLGCYGMGIPVGKLALYTACGGVKPHECLPVMLDVGTDNEIRHFSLMQFLKKLLGSHVPELTPSKEAASKEAIDRYGMNCLIQFEDFANANAFRLLHKYRNKYCTFNDDIQESYLKSHFPNSPRALLAALGIANLIVMAMEKEGVSKEAAVKRIWMVDSKGLIVKGRASLTAEKTRFAHEHAEMKNLEDIVKDIKPSVLIGVAAIGGAFTKEILQDMAALNKRPIIFALSNPTSKAECTAEQCYKYTEGRGIFASGSPFDPVTLPNGKTLYPGQGNNSYVFPGVALGVIACGLKHIGEDVFLTTAEVIAEQVSEENLQEGRLYPPLVTIQHVSLKIAVRIAEEAYRNNTASTYPQPKDLEAFIQSQIYSTDYNSFVADSYTWPEEAMKEPP